MVGPTSAPRPPRRSPIAQWPGLIKQRFIALPWRRIFFGCLLLVVFGIVALGATWLRICAGGKCPDISVLNQWDPDEASKVFAADGRLITDLGLGTNRRTNITLKQMSPAIPAAFLAIEDKRFYEHGGFDWVGFLGALKDNLLHFHLTQRGFSTITMQLARDIFSEDLPANQRGIRGIPRKLREVRVAEDIEKVYSKDKILELYLNFINLGNGANGVEQASLRYFGKHASEVNIAEAAMLAALPKAPYSYNPRLFPAAALKRRNTVIDELRGPGGLSAEEAESWKSYPILLSSHSDYNDHGRYFVEFVRQQLLSRFPDINTGGYRIYTTLDLDAEIAVENACEDQAERIENGEITSMGKYQHITFPAYIEKRGDDTTAVVNTPYLQCAAMVMEAKTGNILAMVGGRNFDESKFNRMTQAGRQPGSTFKPIMYTAVIESGQSFDDTAVDSLYTYQMPEGQDPWTPTNYDGKTTGKLMTMREGLWGSVNTLAAHFGMKAGIGRVLDAARRFGITAKIDSVPSIMIGTATVKPIEMIAAYTTFANLGKRSVPNAILEVQDKNGKRLWKPERKLYDVIDSNTAFTMTTALKGVVQHGTAMGAVWDKGFQIPSGGKTGTTSDHNDVWYIGFTQDLVGGIWMGFDLPKWIGTNAQGGLLAAPAYTQFMLEIYQRRKAPEDWVRPDMTPAQPIRIGGGNH